MAGAQNVPDKVRNLLNGEMHARRGALWAVLPLLLLALVTVACGSTPLPPTPTATTEPQPTATTAAATPTVMPAPKCTMMPTDTTQPAPTRLPTSPAPSSTPIPPTLPPAPTSSPPPAPKAVETILPSQPAPTATPGPVKIYGLDFSPYMAGQDPNQGSVIREQQLRGRLALIAPYTQWVRTYGMTHGLEAAGRVAHELGLKVALEAWLGPNAPGNENDLQIAKLIAAGRAHEADLLIVSSEVLFRRDSQRTNDLPEADLVRYIKQVKQAVPDLPVTTAETLDALEKHPAVVAEIDMVLADIYPYWGGVSSDGAAAWLSQQYQRAQKLAGNKPVIIAETGWPSCGEANGDAVASPENAARYFRDFVAWARANDAPYFYFEAFDEGWKAQHEGERGACWGILDRDGRLKPGMRDGFR